MKVSMIVPVYNSAKYLNKCINSLVNQTLKEIEIIIVNDGSTDSSVEIINAWAKKDKRIKLYNKKNGGQASARNLGLKKAKGEYISFVDSDDYIDVNLCKIIYSIASKESLDIVIFNYHLVVNNIIKETNPLFDKTKSLLPREYMISTPSPCNKMFKKSFLAKINYQFPEGFIYEDLASIPTLGIYNPNIKYVNKFLYYYVQSDNSTMRNDIYKKKYEDIFSAVDYLYKEINEKEYDKELEFLVIYHLLYLGSINFYKYNKKKQIMRISNFMKSKFPNWSKNEILKNKFSKKEISYMKLFYYKLFFIIKIYKFIFKKKIDYNNQTSF